MQKKVTKLTIDVQLKIVSYIPITILLWFCGPELWVIAQCFDG